MKVCLSILLYSTEILATLFAFEMLLVELRKGDMSMAVDESTDTSHFFDDKCFREEFCLTRKTNFIATSLLAAENV